MHVTRLDDAQTYEAPNHFGMRCLRLQGKDAGPSTQMWMGMRQLLPGGHTTLDGSPIEKLYLVLDGRLTDILCRLPKGTDAEKLLDAMLRLTVGRPPGA